MQPPLALAHLSTSAPEIPREVLGCVLAFRNEPHGELELRMGGFAHSKFCPGVSKDVFDQLERDLAESTTLEHDVGWVEVVDYFYMNQRGEAVRTRVEYDADQMEVSKRHVCKQSMHAVVLRRGDDDDHGHAAAHDEVCKLAFAIETPILDPPTTCMPTYVRIKQRRCFRDVRDRRVVWSYELSKTWSANNRSAVEHLQLLSEPIYELEVELVDEGRAYTGARSDEQVAASLLLKTKLLLGEELSQSLRVVVATDVKKRAAGCRSKNKHAAHAATTTTTTK